MENTFARTAKTERTTIEDLPTVGTELADEQLMLASGGMRAYASYEGASCTFNNDTDYHRVD